MDAAPSSSPPSAAPTAITAAAVPPLPPPAPPPPSQPGLMTTWPRSAQGAAVVLLGVAATLLMLRFLGSLGWGARPTDLERGAALAYRVDLNQAPRAELLQLPGVGPKMVERIEEYRRASGGFRSVDDLRKVPGVGPVTLEKLRPWVSVKADEEEPPAVAAPTPRPVEKRPPAPPKPKGKKEASLTELIDVNKATAAELMKLPGIGPKLSQRIVDERTLRGPFRSVEELRRVPGIGPKTMERLRPYVTVGDAPVKVVAGE